MVKQMYVNILYMQIWQAQFDSAYNLLMMLLNDNT